MSEAQLNAKKIAAILEAGQGSADLYRTIVAGPSGQRADLCVGRVRYREFGPDEFEIRDHRDGELAGYARYYEPGSWSITEVTSDGTLSWVGHASSLSVGVDALFNGVHVATGNHDSRRVSPDTIRR
jgi:hypothetical protein